jgi:hypothetical protein
MHMHICQLRPPKESRGNDHPFLWSDGAAWGLGPEGLEGPLHNGCPQGHLYPAPARETVDLGGASATLVDDCQARFRSKMLS